MTPESIERELAEIQSTQAQNLDELFEKIQALGLLRRKAAAIHGFCLVSTDNFSQDAQPMQIAG